MRQNHRQNPLLFLSLLFFSAVSAQTCSGSLSYSLRQRYVSGSQTYSIWDINLQNTGSCGITGADIFFGSLVGSFSQNWNILVAPGLPYFTLTNFGDFIQSGQSYGGAGVILDNDLDPQFSLHSVSCQTCALISPNPDQINLDISVFSIQSSYSEPASATVLLTPVAPEFYKILGGGLANTESTSYYLSQSYPVNSSGWFVEARPLVADVGPTQITAYIVALFDPFDNFDVQYYSSGFSGAQQSSGTASVSVPSDYTLIGGGVQTDEFVFENYPSSGNTWTASFTTQPLGQGALSGLGVNAFAIGIKPNNQNYVVVQQVFSQTLHEVNLNEGDAFELSASATSPYRTTNGGFQFQNFIDISAYPVIPNIWKVNAAASSSAANGQIVVYNLGAAVSVGNGGTTSPPSTSGNQQPCSSINIQQTLATSWNTGSQWSVVVTNSGSAAITNFILTANNNDITNIWSVTDQGNGVYSPPSWISSIPIGGTLQFGYVSTTQSQVNFELQSLQC